MLKSIARGDVDKSHPAEFDLLQPPRAPRVSVRTATVDDLDEIYRLIARNVAFPVAAPEAMRFAMSINRNNIVVFSRHGEIVGLYAMLMLAPAGLEALLTGEFNGLDPKVAHLAPRLETPAAIYQWLVVAPGVAAEGITEVSRFLRNPFYRSANLYMRSASQSGTRIATALGFRALPGAASRGLYRYVRIANRVVAAPAAAQVALSDAA